MTIYSLFVLLSQFWSSLLLHSSSNCCLLTCIQALQEPGKVVRYSHLIKNSPLFIVIQIVKGIHVVNEGAVEGFFSGTCLLSLWSNECWQFDILFLCFLKVIFYTWKFSVHILLKASCKDFEHNLATMWSKYNFITVWMSLNCPSLRLEWKHLFQSCGHHWVFQICWHIECSTLTTLSWNLK